MHDRQIGRTFALQNATSINSQLPIVARQIRAIAHQAPKQDAFPKVVIALPFSVVLDDTLFVHATPQDDETVVTELTTDERLAELLAGIEQRRVVAGHTHMQLERRVGDVVFVNAGSVGRPYEARPGAYWAFLDGEEVELRRSDYDLERAAELVRGSGHPQAEELAVENVLRVPSRAEALSVFGG